MSDTTLDLNGLSMERLNILIEFYKDDEPMTKQLMGIKAIKERELLAEQAEVDFKAAIMANLPPKPDSLDLHNLYIGYGMKYRKLTNEERKGLRKTMPNLTEEELDERKVETGEGYFDVEINKPIIIRSDGRSSSDNKPKPRQRAVSVNKVVDGKLVFVGNFKTGADCCRFEGLNYGASSPIAFLQRNHYDVTPYDGDDFMETT
jgi:hypothetical protein